MTCAIQPMALPNTRLKSFRKSVHLAPRHTCRSIALRTVTHEKSNLAARHCDIISTTASHPLHRHHLAVAAGPIRPSFLQALASASDDTSAHPRSTQTHSQHVRTRTPTNPRHRASEPISKRMGTYTSRSRSVANTNHARKTVGSSSKVRTWWPCTAKNGNPSTSRLSQTIHLPILPQAGVSPSPNAALAPSSPSSS